MKKLHTAPAPGFTEVTIASEPCEARRVQDTIEHLLQQRNTQEHDLFSVKLALEEEHGNQMDRGKQVHISYRVLPDRFDVRIIDEGRGFDPSDVPDPTAIENLERPCGRGLMLMRHYMNEVTYNDRGNAVSMTKFFKR
jgi:serine/threonine-protein kinase RsbW